YVGRDVEQIVRDLVEAAIAQTREKKRKDVQARAQLAAEERVVNALVGENASATTKDSFRRRLRAGELKHKETGQGGTAAGGGPGAACRVSTARACPARRWAPSRSATSSASSAAAAPRRAVSRSRNPT